MSAFLLKSKPILDFFNLYQKTVVRDREIRLDLFLIGDDPASQIYVQKKIELATTLGIKAVLHEYDADSNYEVIKSEIRKVSDDPNVNGMMIQLPVPGTLDIRELYNQIDPKKDIESLSDTNVSKRAYGEKTYLPATARAVKKLLEFYSVDMEGMHVAMVGDSDIVGKPIAQMCLDARATVTICHKQTKDLKEITKMADIIIVAIGQPKFINEEYVRGDNTQIIIDIGINDIGIRAKTGKRIICGDVDFQSVQDKVYAITPVPGGIGPLTVLSLIENLLESVI